MLGIDRAARKLFASQEGVPSLEFVNLPQYTFWQ